MLLIPGCCLRLYLFQPTARHAQDRRKFSNNALYKWEAIGITKMPNACKTHGLPQDFPLLASRMTWARQTTKSICSKVIIPCARSKSDLCDQNSRKPQPSPPGCGSFCGWSLRRCLPILSSLDSCRGWRPLLMAQWFELLNKALIAASAMMLLVSTSFWKTAESG